MNEESNVGGSSMICVNQEVQKIDIETGRGTLIKNIPLFYWKTFIDWFLERFDQDDLMHDRTEIIPGKDKNAHSTGSTNNLHLESCFEGTELFIGTEACRYRHNNLYHNIFYKLILLVLESGQFQTFYKILEEGKLLQGIVDFLSFSVQSPHNATHFSQIGFVWKMANLIRVLSEKLGEIEEMKRRHKGGELSEVSSSNEEHKMRQISTSDEITLTLSHSPWNILLKYIKMHSSWQKFLPTLCKETIKSYLNPGFGLEIKKQEKKFPTFMFCFSPNDSYALPLDAKVKESNEDKESNVEGQNDLQNGIIRTADERRDDKQAKSMSMAKLGWNSEYAENILLLDLKKKTNILRGLDCITRRSQNVKEKVIKLREM